ncbi:hypothetical protein [Jatrophihabitans fulvus]
MRWEGLFADLEAQAEALEQAERAAEVEERTRAEVGRLGVHERLRAGVGMAVRLRVAGGLALAGRLDRVGPDWLLIAEDAGREAVVATAALLGVRGLARWSAAPGGEGVVASRLTLRHALRGVARDRAVVRVHLVDGSTLDGTLDRVGADFVELAAHAPGEVRRRNDVRENELVPLPALAAVRRAGG